MKKFMSTTCLVVLSSFFVIPNHANATMYSFFDLTGLDNTRIWSLSKATDINDAGIVVGHWLDNAFAYDSHTGVFVHHISEASDSYAYSINNDNQIYGYGRSLSFSNWRVGPHNFIYDFDYGYYSILTEPLNFSGENSDIELDDSGQLVTKAEYLGPANLLDLLPENSGWGSLNPLAINSSGQIVGSGRLFSDGIDSSVYQRAFLMTPITSQVPEPTTLFVFGMGLSGIFISRLKKKK